jgi:hypothetical protein
MTVRHLKGFLPAAVLAAVAASGTPARADQCDAKVPFSFTVGARTLSPGTYTISAQGMSEGVLFIHNTNSGAFTLGTQIQSRKDTTPKLVFHRYGDQYVLREIWMGDGIGRELPESHIERELRETAVHKTAALAYERVVIRLL